MERYTLTLYTFNFIDNNNSYIFTNMEKILDSNPTNQKTQVEIEKFLYNQGKHILEDIYLPKL